MSTSMEPFRICCVLKYHLKWRKFGDRRHNCISEENIASIFIYLQQGSWTLHWGFSVICQITQYRAAPRVTLYFRPWPVWPRFFTLMQRYSISWNWRKVYIFVLPLKAIIVMFFAISLQRIAQHLQRSLMN